VTEHAGVGSTAPDDGPDLGAEAAVVPWAQVWADVARQVGEHRGAGRRHLLTEDTVRMCSILSLQATGVAPGDMTIEVFDPVLKGGKVDLVVGPPEHRTVVELKYPRGSRTGISPDTMTFGELLRDFLRVALVPAADRWVVTVLEPELRRYLSRRDSPVWADTPGAEMVLEREVLEGLPKTARDAIGPLAWRLPVRAECVVAAPVDVDLALFAFRVAAPDAAATVAPLAVGLHALAPSPTPALPTRATSSARAARRPTARSEILDAIEALLVRSGRDEVSVQAVVDEMRRRGSSYAESTVRTMMTSHMCVQVQGPNIASYDDLERVDRGTYRLRNRPKPR
jgi:hypothetical protein